MSARMFYLAVCTECGNSQMPFADEQERDDWAMKHAEGSGHNLLLTKVVRG